MNKYFKAFLYRGMMFGGFGPIIAAIVYLIISFNVKEFSVSGREVFIAVISIYILAFLCAGASVFNHIEHWPISKSLLCHFSVLYPAYTLCYLINDWIPFDWRVVSVYTLIFAVAYLLIWGIVYLCVRRASRKLNDMIKRTQD